MQKYTKGEWGLFPIIILLSHFLPLKAHISHRLLIFLFSVFQNSIIESFAANAPTQNRTATTVGGISTAPERQTTQGAEKPASNVQFYKIRISTPGIRCEQEASDPDSKMSKEEPEGQTDSGGGPIRDGEGGGDGEFSGWSNGRHPLLLWGSLLLASLSRPSHPLPRPKAC